MKKLIHCAVAAAMLAAGGAAMAQSAECNAGSAWGVNPGCGSSNATHQASPYGGWVDTTRGGVIPNQSYGYGYGLYGALPQVIAQGLALPQVVAPYERTRRDRDGDGIRNNRDRYPDDPRYR